jgi:hypothetical protein
MSKTGKNLKKVDEKIHWNLQKKPETSINSSKKDNPISNL